MYTQNIQPTRNKVSAAVEKKLSYCRPNFIFVLKLIDGKYVIGQASNPSRRIAAINSGHNRAIPKSLQVRAIVGIKRQTETRNLISVAKVFFDRKGIDNVITV